MEMEKRTLQFRLVESEEFDFHGVVNRVGELSKDMGWGKHTFKERISPGAFQRAIDNLEDGYDIFLLYMHNQNNVLASIRSDTLQLVETENGLEAKASFPETSLAKDVRELVKKGIVREMSFGFIPTKTKTERIQKEEEKTETIVTIEEMRLFEVSIVTIGAYNDTKALSRSYTDLLEFKEESVDETAFLIAKNKIRLLEAECEIK